MAKELSHMKPTLQDQNGKPKVNLVIESGHCVGTAGNCRVNTAGDDKFVRQELNDVNEADFIL